MNPRRLDVEAYRDNLLQVSADLESEDARRCRSIWTRPTITAERSTARVSRGRLNTLLALYDFPDPMMTAPRRELTTSPLQQLFVMNSPFMQERASHLVKRVNDAAGPTSAKVRDMYRYAVDRDPTPKELDTALTYLNKGTLAQFAQALLASNEVIFWP